MALKIPPAAVGTITLNNTLIAGNSAAVDNDVSGAAIGSNNLIGDATGLASRIEPIRVGGRLAQTVPTLTAARVA